MPSHGTYKWLTLNGNLEESIYMDQSHDFEDTSRPNLVWKLTKALYGVKQAPRAWFQKLLSTLDEVGFIGSKLDISMFISLTTTRTKILLIYIDDIVVKVINDNLCIFLVINSSIFVFILLFSCVIIIYFISYEKMSF